MPTNPFHTSVYANYRRQFLISYKAEFLGTDEDIETIFEESNGFGSAEEQDAYVLEAMWDINMKGV